MSLKIKSALLFGILGGASTFAFQIILYYNGTHPLGSKGLFAATYVPVLVGVFGLLYFRSSRPDRHLYFWEAFQLSATAHLVQALWVGLALWVYGLTNPEFITEWHNINVELVEKSKEGLIADKGEQAFNDILTATKKPIASYEIFLKIFFWILLVGILTTPFISAILRKKPKAIDPTTNAHPPSKQ